MHKPRYRAWVDRVLCGSRIHGTKWKINLCVLAGSCLLLGSVALLQLQLAIVGEDPSRWSNEGQLTGNHGHEGQSNGKFKPLRGGEESRGKFEHLRRKMGSRETGSFGDMEGAANFEEEINRGSGLSEALDSAEDEVGSRFEDYEKDMEMEDEDVDEFESSGGDVGNWLKEVENSAEHIKNGQPSHRDTNLKQAEKVLLGGVKQQITELMVGDVGGAIEGAVATGANSNGADLQRAELALLNLIDLQSEKNGTSEILPPANAPYRSSFEAQASRVDSSSVDIKKSELKKFKDGARIWDEEERKKVELRDSTKDDSGRVVFSTDDEPIDEDTQSRLDLILDIEDVLMIKKGASPKKESWGKIQDSKSSKNRKGAKISSDPLNPANNPLLQDPDTVGQGGLTKNDRALLKAFGWANYATHSLHMDRNGDTDRNQDEESNRYLREERVGGSSRLGNILEIGYKEIHGERSLNKIDPQSLMNAGPIKSEIEEGKERVLTANSPAKYKLEYNETDKSKVIPEILRKLERPKNLSEIPMNVKKRGNSIHKMNPKGEKRRWGNFPGLHSQLTFSGFMEEFLFNHKCSLRVFMAWMTAPWSFTVRHQRVLESLLLLHPNACVVVFSETIELNFFKSFVQDGEKLPDGTSTIMDPDLGSPVWQALGLADHFCSFGAVCRYRVAAVMPNLEELLGGTPTDVFAMIWMEWRKVDLFHIHYSELLRLVALFKYGGIYLDLDMMILKPLNGLKNTIGTEVLANGQVRPNGAIMVFERFSPFLNRCMIEFTATYDERLRDWNGAALLDRVVNTPPDGDDVKSTVGDKPHMEPPLSFFPLDSANISRYFVASEDGVAIAQEQEMLDEILLKSFAVHLWNGLTSKLVPDSGSLVEKLMERNCLRCTDIL